MNTTNVIEEVAKQAVTAPRAKTAPVIRHQIQRSPEHLEIDRTNRIADKGFKIIDRSAFERTYHDEKYDIDLPVFAFFNTKRNPIVEQHFIKEDGVVQRIGVDSDLYNNGLVNSDNVDWINPQQLSKFFPPPVKKIHTLAR